MRISPHRHSTVMNCVDCHWRVMMRLWRVDLRCGWPQWLAVLHVEPWLSVILAIVESGGGISGCWCELGIIQLWFYWSVVSRVGFAQVLLGKCNGLVKTYPAFPVLLIHKLYPWLVLLGPWVHQFNDVVDHGAFLFLVGQHPVRDGKHLFFIGGKVWVHPHFYIVLLVYTDHAIFY